MAERVARAKQLMAERQEERERQEEDKEKNQEMERRKLGQVQLLLGHLLNSLARCCRSRRGARRRAS